MVDQTARIPIIRIMRCLLISIQMALHDDLLEQLIDDLGEAIERHRPRGVMIELANVGIIDSFTTRILNQIGTMARLMGARTMVAGIQPGVAMTMVEMGIELEGIETVLSIDDAMQLLGFRIDDAETNDTQFFLAPPAPRADERSANATPEPIRADHHH